MHKCIKDTVRKPRGDMLQHVELTQCTHSLNFLLRKLVSQAGRQADMFKQLHEHSFCLRKTLHQNKREKAVTGYSVDTNCKPTTLNALAQVIMHNQRITGPVVC